MPFTQTPPAFTWDNLNDTWATLFETWLGEFDPVTQILLGDTLEDITDSAFAVSISRGRNRDLQRTNAGSISATLRNETRRFDPQADTPLKPLLRPRVPITLKVDGQTAFTGVVNDWDFNYDIGGQSTASISGADAFTFFAQETAFGSAVAEPSGERLNRVLDDLPIPFPTDRRNIDAGNATFAAQEYDENALGYLQQIEESEGGLIFMSKFGEVNLQQRLIQPLDEAVQFTDDGSGVPYENIEISFGTDLLANSVTVTSEEGTASAVDTDSVNLNGVAELRIDSLLIEGGLQGLADYLLFRFGVPEYRIAAVTVNLRGFSAEKRAEVFQLELGSQADVIFTPNGIGDPIVIRNRIAGISHDISIDSHLMTFNFEALGFALFILDDEDAGKLNNTDFVLGF
jgi:hypothetical protein